MPRYLIVARDAGDWAELAVSASDIQSVLNEYRAWSQRIAALGKMQGGQKLKDGEGRVLNGSGASMRVTDGPHAASKEIIGGFWIISADSYDEAVKLAAESPHLRFGSLEVREIEEMGD